MASTFTDSELRQIHAQFRAWDADNSGYVETHEIVDIGKLLNMNLGDAEARKMLQEWDRDGNGKLDLQEFVAFCASVKGGSQSKLGHIQQEHKKLVQVKGASGLHSFAEEEMAAFAQHLNISLGSDPDLDYLMPIATAEGDPDMFRKVRDGVLLAKFINYAVPETIDERALNKNKEKNSVFQINENLNLVISAAKSIGVQTVNLGASELQEGEKFPHLVLGMIWQLVKISLLNSINLKNHPELIRLLEEGEELADLLRMPPEQLLLRWFNYHLKNANHHRRVHNFGGDVRDSENYTVLLHQIAPHTCDTSAMQTDDMEERARRVIGNAERLNVQAFIKPSDIAKGNPRLNLAFTAAIFNQCPGLDPMTDEEMEKAGLLDDDFGGSREERAFRMWINSMGLEHKDGTALYINNLFEDCKDGLALLHVMDHVEPGCVSWKQVETKPSNKFKKVANCNYAVLIGKQLKFSLVGIGGSDITDGNKKLVLALVWQLMRYHTLKFLAQVQSQKFGGDPSKIDDAAIISWANSMVKTGRHMASFKDPSLSDALFFIDLLAAVEPRIINRDYVTEGKTEEDKMNNAKYAISVARKLGAVIFLLPEDIVEVNPKMILTFTASIMSVSK